MTSNRFAALLTLLDAALAADDAAAHLDALNEFRAALDEPGGRAEYLREYERAKPDSVFFRYQREG